jgi:RNase P subunit RPR2
MREKLNYLYLDSHERKLLIQSLMELKNQLIQQGRYTDCVANLFLKLQTHLPREYKLNMCKAYYRAAYSY